MHTQRHVVTYDEVTGVYPYVINLASCSSARKKLLHTINHPRVSSIPYQVVSRGGISEDFFDLNAAIERYNELY